MDEERRKRLMEMFNPNKERTSEQEERLALIKEYKKRFGENFGYIWGFHRDEEKFPTDEDLIKYCLKKGKSLRQLYPKHYNKDYEKLFREHEIYWE
jgi:predicted secreted acid phosphatase